MTALFDRQSRYSQQGWLKPRLSALGRRSFWSAAVIFAVVLSCLAWSAGPAGAGAIATNQAPLPANCPTAANPASAASNAINGAFGEPSNHFLNNGVLTDSGSFGGITVTNLTATFCGLLRLPWWPQVPDPVPGAPAITPSIPEVGGIAPSDKANGSLDANLTTTYPGIGGTIGLYFVGPTTLVARQNQRPGGPLDADASTEIVAKASVSVFGLPTPVTCWIGGGPGSSTLADGAKVGAGPATIYLSTATPPSLTPAGGQNSAPFTGPLGDAHSILDAQPFTLQSESCSPDVALPITGSLVSTVVNQLLGPGARLSLAWNLRLSIG